MTVQIELTQEMEEVLESRARLQGIPVEHCARQILRDALTVVPAQRQRATQEEFRAFLDAMAGKGTKGAPANSDTFSRETIYGEHD